MKYGIQSKDNKVIVSLSGRVSLPSRESFVEMLEGVFEKKPERIEIEVFNLDFIDSAGLGMLLSLRQQAKKDNIHVSLIKPQGSVKELLEQSCFDTLFEIVE